MSSSSFAAPPRKSRAEASRINGARSSGPKTAAGKQHAARNALKHGLRAAKFVAVDAEDRQAFDTLESMLMDELAPTGALQTVLVTRIARAAWRLERADRIEGDLLERHGFDGNLGMALIRDGNGTRAFDTLLRYRATALRELWRTLRLLKALQAEELDADQPACDSALDPALAITGPLLATLPNEPEGRRNPGVTRFSRAANEPEPAESVHTGWVWANSK